MREGVERPAELRCAGRISLVRAAPLEQPSRARRTRAETVGDRGREVAAVAGERLVAAVARRAPR